MLSVQPPPLPIPTHGTKLLRIQEVHFRKQWLALEWRTDAQRRQKIHWFWVVHFSPKMVLPGRSVCVYSSPTCADCRICRNAAEGPHILLTPGISMLGNGTGACGPCPKAWAPHWSCATRGGLLAPSHRKPKHQTKGFASSNAIKVNLLHPSQGDAKFLFLVQGGFFCFNNRTRKSQPQAFIQLCCRRSNTAPNHEHKGILSGTDLAPSKRAQPCSKQVWTLRNCVRHCGMLWGWTLKNDVAFVGRKSKWLGDL